MRGALAVLTTAVLALTVAPSASAATDVHPEWGSTSAPDGVLKRGCHDYPYSYAITPPEGDWSLETFLIGPRGKRVASGFFVTGDDALSGTSSFRVCRETVRSGRFRIEGLVSVQNGLDYVEGTLPTSHFRLRRAHPHH